MQRTEWFKRNFPPIEDNGVLPSIVERLDGTPARIDEMTHLFSDSLLVLKLHNKWSIKEHIGHLADLEPLWYGRLEDILAKESEMRMADLTNQRTTAANHNATEMKALAELFRKRRQDFVERILSLNDDQLLNGALHPRLRIPMRVVDLAYFVAEHDDHHLATTREIWRAKG